MVDGPGVMVSPPEAVAVHLPLITLQSAWALNVPPGLNQTVYDERPAGGTTPWWTGSRVVIVVSCQLVPTRSAPGLGVGLGVGVGVGAGVGFGVGVGVGAVVGVAVG